MDDTDEEITNRESIKRDANGKKITKNKIIDRMLAKIERLIRFNEGNGNDNRLRDTKISNLNLAKQETSEISRLEAKSNAQAIKVKQNK
jgi:hypothetical protein